MVFASDKIPSLKHITMETFCKDLENKSPVDAREKSITDLAKNQFLSTDLLGNLDEENAIQEPHTLLGYLENSRRWVVASSILSCYEREGAYPITFSPDNNLLITAEPEEVVSGFSVNNSTKRLKVWNIAQKELKHTYNNYSGNAKTVRFLGSNKLLFATNDARLAITDIYSGKIHMAPYHTDPIKIVMADKKGEKFISANNTLRLWQTTPFQFARAELKTLDCAFLSALFLDDTSLVSGSEDGTLYFWDLKSNSETRINYYAGAIRSIVATLDGMKVIAANDNYIHIWDRQANKDVIFADELDDIKFLRLSADDKKVVYATGSTIKVIDLTTQESNTLITNVAVNSVMVTPESNDAVCCVEKYNDYLKKNESHIKIFDLTTNIQIAEHYADQARNIAIAHNCLAVNSHHGSIELLKYGMKWKDILKNMPVNPEVGQFNEQEDEDYQEDRYYDEYA